MQYRVISGIFLCLLALTSLQLRAEPTQADLLRLMQMSGLQSQLETLPGATRTALLNTTRSQGGLPDAQEQHLAAVIERHLQPDVFIDSMVEQAQSLLSAAEVSALIEWYESATARALRANEQEASSTLAYMDMIAEKDQLLADTEALQRVHIIDEYSLTTELSTAIQSDTMLTLYVALSHIANHGEAVDVAQLRANLGDYDHDLRAQNREIVTLWMLYAYQYADAAEIEAYAAVLQSPAHQKFSLAMLRGYREASAQSIRSLAQGLTQLARHDAQY